MMRVDKFQAHDCKQKLSSELIFRGNSNVFIPQIYLILTFECDLGTSTAVNIMKSNEKFNKHNKDKYRFYEKSLESQRMLDNSLITRRLM